MKKNYLLPQLPYGYKDLEPHISELQLKIHHEKHPEEFYLARLRENPDGLTGIPKSLWSNKKLVVYNFLCEIEKVRKKGAFPL